MTSSYNDECALCRGMINSGAPYSNGMIGRIVGLVGIVR